MRPAPATVAAARGVGRVFADRAVLAGLDLRVARGEHLVLLGASGVGKSLALRLLLGLERPDAGEVSLFGAPIAARRARAAQLARVGFVPERDALFDDRSVEENVGFALPAGRARAAARRAVRESLLLVGLKHVEHLRPPALPAGARRRVALARAVAHAPELLVVDEPAAGLDPVAAAALHALVAQLRTRLDLTVLVASRDPRALDGADRAAFLHAGRVALAAPVAALATATDAALQQLLAGRPHGPIAP